MNRCERMQKHLKLLRQSAGWTQGVLADNIGMSRSTIFNLEKGTAVLKQKHYEKLWRVFMDEVKRNSSYIHLRESDDCEECYKFVDGMSLTSFIMRHLIKAEEDPFKTIEDRTKVIDELKYHEEILGYWCRGNYLKDVAHDANFDFGIFLSTSDELDYLRLDHVIEPQRFRIGTGKEIVV